MLKMVKLLVKFNSILNKKVKILFLFFGIMIIYSLSYKSISNRVSKSYGFEMNKKRAELNLITIKRDWSLDSIENLTDEYNIFDKKPNLWDKIKDQNIYCQNWSLKGKDTLKPYHKTKRIFYIKSFWFWKNKIEYESNIYINPINKYEYIELSNDFYFVDNNFHNSMDTLKTKYKIELEKKYNDSLNRIGYWKCGTDLFDLKFDTIGISQSKTNNILNNWNIKRN